ncbi:MAG: ABC transporter ATP-binding protein, partial [Candidatus Nanopelagicales bacterium]
PDVDKAQRLLDGQVEHYDDQSVLVHVSDAAELNARLVSAGVRVYEIGPERHTLEDVVLAATEPGSDRIAST